MSSQIVPMPELGESVMEGVVVEWLVQEGDRIAVDQSLCEIETDKANAEVPSPIEGYVVKLLVEVEGTVEVGAPLLEISAEAPSGVSKPADAAPAAEAKPAAGDSKPAPPAPPRPRVNVNPGPISPEDMKPPAPAGPMTTNQAGPAAIGDLIQSMMGASAPAAAPATKPAAPAQESSDRWSPLGFPAGKTAYKYPQPVINEEDRVEKFSRRRQKIAGHMVVSQSVSPHVVTVAEVDMTNIVTLRNKHKANLKAQGIGLTYLTFLLKATVQALREFPIMNSVVGDNELIYKGRINLGCAVEAPDGLVVPVIKDADQLTLIGLAQQLSRLAKAARNNELAPTDLAGGTFTVSNPGLRGNLYGGAIINQPQVGIVRMGEIKKRPMVISKDGQDVIAIRSMMYLALSYDHRAVDGVTGNSFLFRIRELLDAADFHI